MHNPKEDGTPKSISKIAAPFLVWSDKFQINKVEQ